MGIVLQLSPGQPTGGVNPLRIRPPQAVECGSMEAVGSSTRADTATDFPLYHRPGAIALVTTDWDACESLLSRCHGHCPLRVFHSVDSFLNCLQQEPPVLDHDHWLHRQLLTTSPGQALLIPAILNYWATQPARLNLTQACIVDDLMAGRDGLDVLGELIGWRGLRVLLTDGTATPELSSALELGLVDRWVAKTSTLAVEHLVASLTTQLMVPSARTQQLWASTLNLPQLQVLQSPRVAKALLALAQSRWVEWACIGQPFGVLGLDAQGTASWLQLQLASDRNEAVYQAIARGLPRDDVARVVSGQALVDCAWHDPAAPRALTAFPVDRRARLLGAWQTLPAPHRLGQMEPTGCEAFAVPGVFRQTAW